jgi:hypothetical protein
MNDREVTSGSIVGVAIVMLKEKQSFCLFVDICRGSICVEASVVL